MGLDRLWADWRAGYIREVVDAPHREAECLFCGLAAAPDDDALVVARGEHCYCVLNAYPYTSGHVMVVPYRHGPDLEALPPVEANEVMAFTQRALVACKAAYRPDACNVGLNLGAAAGAGVPHHLHVHVVPRWVADTNFMTTVAETRVLPESLADTLARVRAAWPR